MSGPDAPDGPDADLAGRVAERLGDRWPGCRVGPLTVLAGGRSSLTYGAPVAAGEGLATGSEPDASGPPRKVVVKTIPVGMTAVRNRDVVRQGRLISALFDAGMPVPEPLALDAGDPPTIPPFLVSRFVEGDCWDPTSRSSPGTAPADGIDIGGRAASAAATLARIQRVPLDRLGVHGASGRSLTEEVDRWQAALATTVHAGDPAVERCAGRLRATVPGGRAPVLVHGDFRLGNLLCVGAEVRAVIDWEIWSAGDPRLDLAWFLARFQPFHPTVPPGPPLPAADLLLEAYGCSGGQDHDQLTWFYALAAFKQAAASALIDKRSAPTETGSGRTGALITWAQQQLEARSGSTARRDREGILPSRSGRRARSLGKETR